MHGRSADACYLCVCWYGGYEVRWLGFKLSPLGLSSRGRGRITQRSGNRNRSRGQRSSNLSGGRGAECGGNLNRGRGRGRCWRVSGHDS
jgi:hypothetical protein